MTNKTLFWVFGVIQHLLLGFIIFLIFKSLNSIQGEAVIGMDTQLLLSIGFPLFSLVVKYIIYTRPWIIFEERLISVVTVRIWLPWIKPVWLAMHCKCFSNHWKEGHNILFSHLAAVLSNLKLFNVGHLIRPLFPISLFKCQEVVGSNNTKWNSIVKKEIILSLFAGQHLLQNALQLRIKLNYFLLNLFTVFQIAIMVIHHLICRKPQNLFGMHGLLMPPLSLHRVDVERFI